MPLITFSIVLYQNDIKILKKAIDSILNLKLNFTLFLIDNSPTNDLSFNFHHDRIIYIHNPENPGFGASHNIAIKNSFILNSKFHVVLNPDVYFEVPELDKIVNFMNENENVGLLMPKILFPNGDYQYLCKTNPTFFDLFARGFLPKIFKNIFKTRLNRYEYRDHDLTENIFNIPYLSGCFMFFRTSILQRTELFDENIFMYLEDADITRRILKISQTVYFPHSTVYHHYSGLTHKKWKYKFITIKSAITYFNKWGWVLN